MRKLEIEIDRLICSARLVNAHGQMLANAHFHVAGPIQWSDLLALAAKELNLPAHPPPGMTTQADEAWGVFRGDPEDTWSFHIARVTCGGFRDARSATRAEEFFRRNLDLVEGGPPGAAMEVFGYDEGFAFIDRLGCVHKFGTRQHALSHAEKLGSNPAPSPS